MELICYIVAWLLPTKMYVLILAYDFFPPSQLQLMFYNTDYGSFENAAPLQDGLAAISVLLEVRWSMVD